MAQYSVYCHLVYKAAVVKACSLIGDGLAANLTTEVTTIRGFTGTTLKKPPKRFAENGARSVIWHDAIATAISIWSTVRAT